MFNYTSEGVLRVGKLISHIIIGIILLVVLIGTFRIIDAGERGIVLRVGEINRVISPGLNLKIPLAERVIKQQVRTEKKEVETE